MGRDTRREVIRLANIGERHADTGVVAATYRWSHARRWNSLANRLPGWLLPSVGLAFILGVLLTGLPPVFVAWGIVVVVCGLLGWMSTSLARLLRAVYVDEGAGAGAGDQK